jgi:hypothetical protein
MRLGILQSALIGVESNNHGLTTLKGLQRSGYRNIFRQRKMNHRNPQISETSGLENNRCVKAFGY